MTTPINNTAKTITIELLGKLYHIRCSDQDTSKLQQAAHNLNDTLRELAQNSHSPLPPEKLAIIAALNLSAKLLEIEDQTCTKINKLIQLFT